MAKDIRIIPASGSIALSGSNKVSTITVDDDGKIAVQGSGSTIFDVQGSQGQLFSVTDSLVGSLFSVNDISGLPILEVFDTDKVVMGTFGQNTLVVTGSSVGIGTDVPEYKLHTVGNGYFSDRLLVKTTNTNSDKVDFAVGTAGSPQISWYSNQVQIGGTDMNWSGKVVYDGTFRVAAWDTNIQLYTQGGSGAAARDIIFSPQATGGATTERVRIKGDSGHVGIGTGSPEELLHIKNGDAGVTRYNLSTGMIIEGASSHVGINILSPDNGYGRIYFGAPSSNTAGSIEYIHHPTVTSGFMKFRAGAQDRLYILGNGNVGIGVASPSTKLTVSGSLRLGGVNPNIFIGNEGSGYSDSKIRFNDFTWGIYDEDRSDYFVRRTWSSNLGDYLKISNVTSGADDMIMLSANSGSMFYTDDTLRMRITGGGDVGIGTSNPNARLHVYGAGSTSSTYAAQFRNSNGNNIMYMRNDGVVVMQSGYLYVDHSGGIYSNGSIKARGGVTDDGGDLGLGGQGNTSNLILSGSEYAVFNGNVVVPNGNVGIGTTAPSAQLELRDGTGLKIISANAKIQFGDSSLSQFLKMDGNGNLEFLRNNNSTVNIHVGQSGNIGISTSTPSGSLHIKQGNVSDQDKGYETTTFPNLDGNNNALLTLDGNYTNGQYRSRLVKVDRGGNLPIYFQEARGAAHNYDNVVRFGANSNHPAELQVFGEAEVRDVLRISDASGDQRIVMGNRDSAGVDSPSIIRAANGELRFGRGDSWNPSGSISGGTFTPHMTITKGGNVGIGNTTPAYKLDVSGTTRINNGVGNGSGVDLYLHGSGDQVHTSGGSIFFGEYNYATSTYIRGYDNSAGLYFYANGTLTMNVNGNGNVGIGTTSPSAKLHVRANSSPKILVEAIDTSSPAMTANIELRGYDGRGKGIYLTESGSLAGREIFIGSPYSGNNQLVTIGYNPSGGQSEYHASSSFAVDLANSRVGIGKGLVTPSTLLDVGGGDGTPAGTRFATVINGHNDGVRTLYLDGASNGASMWWGSGNTPHFAIDSMGGGGATFWTYNSGWTQRMELTSGGLLGIGNNAPSYRLDIQNAGSEDANMAIRNTSTGHAGIWFDGSNGDLAGSDYAWIGQRNSLDFEIWTNTSAGDILLTPKNGNGQVEVAGNLTVSGIVTAQEFHTEFVSASIAYESGSTKFGNTVDDSHDFTGSLNVLAQSGATGIDLKRSSTVWMNFNNSSTRNEINFNSPTGLRFFRGSDSTSPLFISSSGRVGIQTTTPAATLDVNGTAQMSTGITENVHYVGASVQHWGDGGTGIYFDTDVVDIRRGGGSALTVNSTGVGIFDTTPSYGLDVNTAARFTGTLYSNNTLRGNSLLIGNTTAAQPRLDGFYMQAGPETGVMLAHPYFMSDLASFVRRGGTVTVTGLTTPPTNFDTLFRPDAEIWSTAASNYTGNDFSIELSDVDHVQGLSYGTYCGIQFGNSGWSPASLMIEWSTDDGSNWTTALSSSAKSDFYYTRLNNGSANITNIKFTMGQPASSLRILNIFATDYGGKGSSMYHLSTDGGNVYGDVAINSSNLTVGGSIYLTNTSTRLHEGSGDALKVTTPSGFVEIGAMNTSHAHIQTDRSNFYFNKELRVDGGLIGAYNEDLQLRTSANTKMTIKDATGFVGIDTSSPATYLEVKSDNTAYGIKLNQHTGTGYAPASILLEANQGTSRGQGIFHYNSQADQAWFTGTVYNKVNKLWAVAYEAQTTFDPSVATDTHSLLVVSASGNVGIGTASPNSLLEVHKDSTSGQFATYRNNTGFFLHRTYADYNNDGATVEYQERVGVDGNYTRIGNFSNHPLYLMTNNSTNMTLLTNGNVGIGTTTPEKTFQVNGQVLIGDTHTRPTNSPFSGSMAQLVLGGSHNTAPNASGPRAKLLITGHDNDDATTVYPIYVEDENGYVDFWIKNRQGAGNDPTIFLNGKAGIGINDPDTQLHVFESGTSGTQTIVATLGSDSLRPVLQFSENVNGTISSGMSIEFDGRLTGADNKLNINDNSGNAKLTVMNGGNVGIGTTTPSAELHVKGAGEVFRLQGDTGQSYMTFYQGTGGRVGYMGTLGTSGMIVESQAQLALYSGGTSTIYLDTNSNVGIGTTTPTSRLHVSGTADVMLIEGSGSTSNTSIFAVDGNNGRLFEVSDDLSDSLFSVNTIAGLPVLEVFADNRVVAGAYNQNDFVISGSRVGIGTDEPAGKLDVSGSLKVQSGDTFGFDGTHAAIYMDVAGRGLSGKFGSNGYSRNLIKSDGSSTISIGENTSLISRILLDAGSTAANGYISLQTNQAERVRVQNDGKVGIGTTSPAEVLDVAGNIRGAQKLILDANDPYIQGIGGNAMRIKHTSGQTMYIRPDEIGLLSIFEGSASPQTMMLGVGAPATNDTSHDSATLSFNTRSRKSDGTAQNHQIYIKGVTYDIANNYSRLDITGANRYYFDNNVGIGTNTPTSTLHVNGTFRSAGIQDSADALAIFINGNEEVGIGTTSPAQKLDVVGNINVSGHVGSNTAQSRDKFRVWNTNEYVIGMKSGYDFGHLGSITGGEYAMSFQMNNDDDRGFWWGDNGHTDDQGAMALTTEGRLNVATSVSIGEGQSTTSPSTTPLYVEGSGSTVLDVQGSQGQLFSVTDSLVGSLFSVNDISGLPILEVFDTDKVVAGTFGQNTLVVTGSLVGIGTDTPDKLLQVHNNDTGGGQSFAAFTNETSGLTQQLLVGINQYEEALFWNENNKSVIFATNNGERMRILNNGNVGINTTSPSEKLHVVGRGYFQDDNASGSLVLARTSNPDQKLYLRGGNGSGEGWVAAQYQLELRSGVNGSTNYDLMLSTAAGEAMRVDASNSNNVGIGTNSPTAKLHVVGSTRFGNSNSHLHQMTGSMLHIYNPSVSSTTSTDMLKLQAYSGDFGADPAGIALAFKHQDSNNSTNEARIKMMTVNDSDFGDNDEAASNLIFTTTNGGVESDKMIITGRGNVGIGTNNPEGYLLRLRGGNNNQLLIENGTASGTAAIFFRPNTTRNVGPYIKSVARGATISDSDLRFGDEDGDTMTINEGKVAIGHVSPSVELDVVGNGRFTGNLEVGHAATTSDTAINIGASRTQNGYAYVDLIGDTTYTDYGLRIIRGNAGANASSQIVHRGTGDFLIKSQDGASVVFGTSATTRMTIRSNGNVGIGTVSPSRMLEVAGDFEATQITVNNEFTLPTVDGNAGEVLQTNGSGTVTWATVSGGGGTADDVKTIASNSNGTRYLTFVDSNNATATGETVYTTDGIYVNPSTDTIYATGNIISYASSDRRLKDNLTPIANATEKISKLSGYEFDWNDKAVDFEGHDVGVVAQEVEEVLPEVVTTRKDGYKAVKYEKMVALLIEGMKEQQAEIEALKEEVRKLKG